MTNATLSWRQWRYCFCASFVHSATIWLMVSSLSPQSLHMGDISCLSNPNLLHNVQCMTNATLSWRQWRYCFCASFVHSATIWLMVSSLSPQSLHMGDISCLSILLFIAFVLKANTDEDFNRNVYVIQQCLFLYFIFCLALKDGLVRFYYYYHYYLSFSQECSYFLVHLPR